MKNIALLIDAENISYKSVPLIFNKLSTFGKICIKRVYGDFSSDPLKAWTETNNEYALKAVHQPNYVSGKNTSDIRITMDTISLYFENQDINAFALASSDSDFTPLVQYLTEKGYAIYGFGDSKRTKSCFANACSQFFNVNKQQNDDDCNDEIVTTSNKKIPFRDIFKAIEICKSKKSSYEDFSYFGEVLSEIRKINPKFNYKNFGGSTLGKFFDKYPEFETITVKSSKYVRKFNYSELIKLTESILITYSNGLSISDLAYSIKQKYGEQLFLKYCSKEDIEKRLKSINYKNFIIENNTIKLAN